MNTREMIQAILITVKANGVPITGDLYFSLIFRTDAELRAICHELHISTKTV
ncbi:hypothetical protein GWN42_11205 [candidate division KSB1 bacterium]|nr:hypothetical protein [candidate division KSB1 bacterium]